MFGRCVDPCLASMAFVCCGMASVRSGSASMHLGTACCPKGFNFNGYSEEVVPRRHTSRLYLILFDGFSMLAQRGREHAILHVYVIVYVCIYTYTYIHIST